MDWAFVDDRLFELVKEHWSKPVGWMLIVLFTSFWGWFIARRRWKARQDYNVVHFAQNTVQLRPTGENNAMEPWLILDGNEDPLDKIVTHPIAAKLIRKAAKKTTEFQPFLRFDPDDRWYVLNHILLAIAEDAKAATRAKLSTKAVVDEVPCVFALTYERYPRMRQGKIRIMLIRQSVFDHPEEMDHDFRFEAPSHSDRVKTLRLMREDYRKGDQAEFCMGVRINVQVFGKE